MLKHAITLCITFALTTAGTLLFTTSCAQPIPNCTSAHKPFAAEYTLTQGDPASPCGQLRGDVLGMQTYFQPGGPNGTPDYQNATLAIRARSLGVLIENADAGGVIDGDVVYYDANAIGSFTTGFPDDDGFCVADDFDAAQVSLPEVPAVPDDPDTPDDESLPAQRAVEVEYQWSEARFVVTADAQGTQFEADLDYTQDGCTARYHVVGVSPAAKCERDEDCKDVNTRLNPDFALRCNTELGLCVLDGELPAYE